MISLSDSVLEVTESILFNCLEDITHPFLFTCYVNSALCYFVLADQFIKFPDVPLFFVKSKDFLYEF